MKYLPARVLFFAGGLAALALSVQAQIVQLNATINGAQETPATASAATGTATMMYNVATNTFDISITLNNFTNTLANSHIHEAAVGVAGGVVTPFGGESLYTRTGNTLTATFKGITYGGHPLTLLQGGAYVNFHSAQFPAGEVRGQLIAQPKRLVAVINSAQEQAAASAGTTITSSAYGAAVMWYDPVANKISLRSSIFNFQNTFANSHFHEAPAGVNGGVVTPLGGASVYANPSPGFYNGSFDIPYTGDPIKLLTGGAYLNFHSNVYPGGEIRGQVRPSDEGSSSRMFNTSALGMAGGGAYLIHGFAINGPDPIRVIITGKGPSLAAYGVTNALSDPWLTLYDSAGRVIATNNDIGTIAAGSEWASIPGIPTNPVESALIVVLPPGNYTAVLNGANGSSGVGLIEVNDLRVVGAPVTAAQ